MIVKAISSAIIGIDSHPVAVEVDLAAGLPVAVRPRRVGQRVALVDADLHVEAPCSFQR